MQRKLVFFCCNINASLLNSPSHLVFQPVHTKGITTDRPVLPPPQGLPGDWLGRVGPLLQNLLGPWVSPRKSHSDQTGAPIPCGRRGGVPSTRGVRAMWTSRQRRAALHYVSSSQWWGRERREGTAGIEQKLFEFEWNCRCGIHSLALDKRLYKTSAC